MRIYPILKVGLSLYIFRYVPNIKMAVVTIGNLEPDGTNVTNTTTLEPENATCPDPLAAIKADLNSWEFIAPAVTLIIFNIVVIGGNSLVIIAVFTSRKLRGVTNTYIVSLAFSDLFLGLLVLPFSSANEVSSNTIIIIFLSV